MRRFSVSLAPWGLASAFLLALGCDRSEPAPRAASPNAPQSDRLAATRRVSVAERDASSTSARADQIIELLDSARYKLQTDDRDGANADYRRAGELAAKLLDRRPELTRRELRAAAIASYFQARALARQSAPQEALRAIEQAFSAGFDNLDHLDADEEFATVRALPEFPAIRAALKTRLAAEARTQLEQRLKEFTPYALEFRLPNLDGEDIALSQFRGQVVVLAFWGTWCVHCRAEVPTLNRIQAAYGERGVQVIGLSYEQAENHAAAVERIRQFQQSKPMDYLCLLGDDATRDQVRPPDDAPSEWVYPLTLVLDRQGQVRLHFAGAVSHTRLETAVQLLLGET